MNLTIKVVFTAQFHQAWPDVEGFLADALKWGEDDYTAEWREFNTLEEAKAWAKGVHKPQMKDGFYQTSTTKGPETLTYAQVIAMKGGKKTANLPKTEVGKSVNRLYVGYKDMANAASAVFFVRRVTRIR